MTTIERPPVRGRASRFFEGAHRWGWFEETSALYTARTGVCARRLFLYPPGTTSAERRAIVFRRRWPTVGGLLALLPALVLAPAPAVTAIGALVAVYLAGFIVAAVLTRRVWRECRVIRCSTVAVGDRYETYGDEHLVTASLASLLALERARDEGRIDEVGFELGWSRVYDLAHARRAE
ncbi:DUF6611 family protein [Microbacterium sp. X-17]|uniref:DUF6611 family protein n=1 Tax=Microbacterium sp. X-17 TaxID=3144404 RepID=UPI0031F4C6E7